MSTDITPSNNEEVVSTSPNPTPPHKNLFADRMRTIGAIDPFLREMHIGLGCALENLLMAAAANGYTTQVSLLPDALDETWVACVDLAPGPTVIPDLYPLIPNRHTNRYPYDIGRSVTSATLDALSALNDDPEVRVFWFASAPLRKQVGDLLVEATHVSVSDTTQIGESDGWYRATWQDLQQYRDGITIDAAGLPDWKRTLGKMLPPQSQEQQDSTFLQNTADQAQTAGAFGLLTVRDGQDRAQQLRAGWLLEQGNVRFTRSILKGW